MSVDMSIRSIEARHDEVSDTCRQKAAGRPEVQVLRAMLRAYEAAGLAAWRSYVRLVVEGKTDESRRVRLDAMQVDTDAQNVRVELAGWLESTETPTAFEMFSGRLAQDYAARLSGVRPIDAPPPKEP